MTASLLAAWWGPLIPVGMVVVAILYATLQAASRRSPGTNTPRPSPAPPSPPPGTPPWGGGLPLPRPRFEIPTPVPPPAPPGPVRSPAPADPFPGLPPVLASLSEDAPADQGSLSTPGHPPRALEAADGRVEIAGSLQARVQEQMNRVDRRLQRPEAAPVPERSPRYRPASTAWIDRLRNPASAREAWVSALIFAPPRSLE